MPDLNGAVAVFWQLSELIGSEKVIWRYDPVLLSNLVDLDSHKSPFTWIAVQLRHKTKKVVIGFTDFYQKNRRNLEEIDSSCFEDILVRENEAYRLVEFLAKVARELEQEIESCSEKMDLSALGVNHGKCIDDKLLDRLFGLKGSPCKDDGQTKECGCVKSVDIGQYNTCAHQCAYCYATDSPSAMEANMDLHGPHSPNLIGGAERIDPELLGPSAVQRPLLGNDKSNPRG